MDESLKATRAFSFVLDYVWRSISNKHQIDHVISGMSGTDSVMLLKELWEAGETRWYLTTDKNNINKDIRYLYVVRKLIARLKQEESNLIISDHLVDKLRKQKW